MLLKTFEILNVYSNVKARILNIASIYHKIMNNGLIVVDFLTQKKV